MTDLFANFNFTIETYILWYFHYKTYVRNSIISWTHFWVKLFASASGRKEASIKFMFFFFFVYNTQKKNENIKW